MTASEAKSGLGAFKLPNPFGAKQDANSAGPIAVLESAGDELRHAFILCDAASVAPCVAELEALSTRAPTTIIAPAEGITLATSKGWVQQTLQDHEGVLTAGVSVQSGYIIDDKGVGKLIPCDGADGGSAGGAPPTLPREDLAEVAIQCALRLSHTAEEGAPTLRVVRVKSTSTQAVRPVKNYDSLIAGPKFRARQGTVKSADWTGQLAPFGVIKASDPNDWRLLVDLTPADAVPLAKAEAEAAVEEAAASAPPAEERAQAPDGAPEQSLTLELTKGALDAKFGVAMNGSPELGVVVTKVVEGSLIEQAGVRIGDTLVAVNGQAVTSAKQATTQLQEAPVGAIVLEVVRGREAAAWLAQNL